MKNNFSNDRFLDNINLVKLFELISAIVVVLDKKGRIRMINEIGAKKLGYQVDDLLYKNWFDIFIPQNIKKEVKAVFKKLMKGEIKNTEYHENHLIKKNKDKSYIAWHNALITDKNKKIIGAISFGEDITERKKFEQDLKNKNKELQKFNQLMVNRELKMVELKRKIKSLQA